MDLIILGTGGNCLDIADAVEALCKKGSKINLKGFLDDNEALQNTKVQGFKVLGSLKKAQLYKECCFVNGIGSPQNYFIKNNIIAKTGLNPNSFCSIIHPASVISRLAHIGSGTVILANSNVCAGTQIEDHVMILPGTTINHDCFIKSYCTVASGVNISGNVYIDENAYIGSGSVISGNIRIGKRALVGAGSVVLNDVDENCVVVGNPAKFIRRINL
jgi:sugar O-acyltransferase (sialic acid O-acetyltransferase NeuD family)